MHCKISKIAEDLETTSTPTLQDICLHCDNISVVKLMRNLVFHAQEASRDSSPFLSWTTTRRRAVG